MRSGSRFITGLQHRSQQAEDSPVKAIIILSEGKFPELRAILVNAGVTAQIIRVSEVDSDYDGAPEVSGNYRGNAKEKTDAFFASWKKNRVQKRKWLKTLGFEESEVVALAEDSGFVLADQRVANHELFSPARAALGDRMPPADAFPGVETNPIIKAVGGPRPFFRLLNRVARNFQHTQQPALDRSLAQVSCVRVVPLNGDWGPVIVEKVQSATFNTSAKPSQAQVSLAHFIVPDMPRNKRDYNRNKLTEAQQNKDGSYWLYLSVKAQAVREVVAELDLAPRQSTPRHGPKRKKSNPLRALQRRRRPSLRHETGVA